MARFAERSLGRQLALQFLFGLEFADASWRDALVEFWRMDPIALTRLAFEPDERPAAPHARPRPAHVAGAKQYAEKLIGGVCECGEDLNKRIVAALDHWTPERVGRVEWVIMRLALYETLYCPETPSAVIIAEAVQLANAFGDKDTPRFVNGLLNRLMTRDAPERLAANAENGAEADPSHDVD